MKWIILALAFISLEVSAGIGTITEQVNKPPSIERSKTSITGA